MSDRSISLVCKTSNYRDSKVKGEVILDWLIAENIVHAIPSDCVLSKGQGYAVSNGAGKVVNDPKSLPFKLITNGLEVITDRRIYHAGQDGLDKVICPECGLDIAEQVGDYFNGWQSGESDSIICPGCNTPNDINEYLFTPVWGFSNLGFTFWNWPVFKDEFIETLIQKLNCSVSVVYSHI
jgi:hypothetical protein